MSYVAKSPSSVSLVGPKLIGLGDTLRRHPGCTKKAVPHLGTQSQVQELIDIGGAIAIM